MATHTCPGASEPCSPCLGLGLRARCAECTVQVCEAVAQIGLAHHEAEAITHLKQATARLGADAAMYTSFVRDDATYASYRSLLACDPRWAAEYARNGWCADDPWLHYALHCSEPIRASELPMLSPRQRLVAHAAAEYGFRSAVIVPTPSPAGQSRVGVLCLGSASEGYFEDPAYGRIKALVRGLAMELQDWWHRRIKAELVARAHISADDLELLRHEDLGHSSKVIAKALGTEAKTIDCRFQRLNIKLDAVNRREAVRRAKLYGLI